MQINNFNYKFQFQLTPEQQKTTLREMKSATVEDHLDQVPAERHEATRKAWDQLIEWMESLINPAL